MCHAGLSLTQSFRTESTHISKIVIFGESQNTLSTFKGHFDTEENYAELKLMGITVHRVTF